MTRKYYELLKKYNNLSDELFLLEKSLDNYCDEMDENGHLDPEHLNALHLQDQVKRARRYMG